MTTRIIALFLSVLLSMATITEARACMCVELTPERSQEIVRDAALIFEGRIVALDTPEQPEEDFDYTTPRPVPENPLYSKARVRILDLYKGAPAGEKVEAYIDTLTSCGYMLQTGDVTNFVLSRKDDVLVQANVCNMPLAKDWATLKEARRRE